MNFPALHGNWVDLVLFVALALYVLEKWRRGFIRGAIDVVGFLLSLLFSLTLYSFTANILIANFSLSRGIAHALGFLLTAFFLEILYSVGVMYFERFIPRNLINSKTNTLLGFIPAVVSGLILASFIFTIAIAMPIRPNIKQDILQSKIGGFLARQTLGLEKTVTDVFGGAVEETLTFLTVKPQGDETVNLNFKTQEVDPDAESEKKMLELINRERGKEGFPSLVPDEPLRAVAQEHCQDMFARGYFSHYNPDGASPFDRMEKAGITYKVAGENLAYAPIVDIAHTGLMNSPGHRKNILSPDFGRAGIGVIQAGVYGRMFCQEFTD